MKITRFALAALTFTALPLLAHRQWMLPSSTVLSGADPWVTVDAAVSNELFYFDHVPMRPVGLTIIRPDGTKGEAENLATGKYRSTFDVHLTQPGTYKIANVSTTVFATWDDNGTPKNWRGTAEAFEREVPKNAKDLKTSRMSNRVELFVTSGKPTAKALELTGVGLELAPDTHPNDLVAGEAAKFRLMLDGKPAANLEVTVIPGGIRYRNQLHEQKITTDAEGRFSVTAKEPGMYWINATTGGAPRGPGGPPNAGGPRPAGGPGGPGGPGGMGRMPQGNRANYVATVEFLPQ